MGAIVSVSNLVRVVAILISAYHIYTGVFGTPEDQFHRSIHLGSMMFILFLMYPTRKGQSNKSVTILSWIFAIGTLITIGYLIVAYDYIQGRYFYVEPLNNWDFYLGLATIFLVLEGSRRTVGWALPITALVFLFYALIGPYLPGILKHSGFTLEVIIEQSYLITEGILGIPIMVSSTYIVLFIIFGAFLEQLGAGQFFMDFSSAVAGRTRGGPGKVAVVASSVFGTLSGSSTANVMVTGTFTIPLMKKAGFRPVFAGAVEAVASTGGQLMPPVMGAVAFVMSEFSGIPYLTVCKHALIPSLLFYLACFISIHFEAVKTGLVGLPREQIPSLKKVMKLQGYQFAPIILIIVIMILGFSPIFAAICAIASVVILSLIKEVILILIGLSKESWMDMGLRMVKNILNAMEKGAKGTVFVVAACACAGIIIGAISLTGLGLKFTVLIKMISMGNLFLALIFTMLAGMLLGMGLPTSAAYIVQASLLIPALVEMGVPLPAAHLFVLYFAIISAITPPVAITAFAAAGVAETRAMATGLESFKLGLTGYIVPFMFVYGPSLLIIGEPLQIVMTVTTAILGIIALASGLQRYFFRKNSLLEQLLFFTSAFMLIHADWQTDLIGISTLSAALFFQWLRIRSEEKVILLAEPAGKEL